MPTYHLTFAGAGRMPVTPGEALRRRLVRTVLRVVGGFVALFCVVDDHVHVVVICPAARLASLRRSLALAMRPVCDTPLDPPFTRPVTRRSHAEWLFGYVLTQTDHHGLDANPATWSGSCLADLVGARAIPGWTDNLKELLARLGPEDALARVGLPPEPLTLASDEQLRRAGAWRLAAAVAFAAAVGPGLTGNTGEVAQARKVCAALGVAAGIAVADLAAAMKIRPKQVARLAAASADPDLARATRIRIELEDRVIAAGAGRRPEGR